MDPRLSLLQRLATLTAEQIEAAKRLDGPMLAELGIQRADLNFELQCSVEEPVAEDQHDALLAAARHLKSLESRLATIAQTVTDALDAALPSTASVVTYGPKGRIG